MTKSNDPFELEIDELSLAIYCMEAVMDELSRARNLHPNWPEDDLVLASAVVVEEAGELLKACMDVRNGKVGVTIDDVYKEAVQTAAMGLRFLKDTKAMRELMVRKMEEGEGVIE
jgi:hypothetical protein